MTEKAAAAESDWLIASGCSSYVVSNIRDAVRPGCSGQTEFRLHYVPFMFYTSGMAEFSIKHLDRDCTETAFRLNHRDHDARRSPGGNVGRVPWKVLTA